ncbi:Extradiol ring-cleavage dioxygenase, class III enzyme, subunit B [Dipodascopsis uninucleata]
MSPSVGTSATDSRLPVYFFSHGGPNFMYADSKDKDLTTTADLGAFNKLREIGKYIVHNIRPQAIIVLSAHWQGGPNTIEVNTAENNSLIYDFYGFPSFMYQLKYPNRGSSEVSSRVIELLNSAGIKSKAVARGLDHGVWVPFMIAFPPATDEQLSIPVIQVSLYGTEDPAKHIEFGRALAPLRDEGVLIIGSGMSVHNLREMWAYLDSVAPYTKAFDSSLRDALITNTGQERESALVGLFKTPSASKAHPTKEHLLPVYVSAGAAYNDKATQLYTSHISSLAYGIYKFE